MPQAPAAAVEPDDEFEFWWYCTEEEHPGAPRYSSQPLFVQPGSVASRIFGTNSDKGCPKCPACQREVSAVPCGGPMMPPMPVVDYHKRFTQQQLMGGIR